MSRGAMAYEYLKVDRSEGVLVLTLHDPPTRNALGREMAAELMQALDEYEQSPEDRMLVITGTDPSFCSGANVRQMGQSIQQREGGTDEPPARLPWGSMEAGLGRRRAESFGGGAAMVPLRIHELQKPSLAAVNGHAYGVGMGVAISCDIRIASEQAAFAEAFVRMGLIPGDGSCWQLPRLIGLSNTFLMQYTGQAVDGNEAFRMGLVSRVVPHDELMPAAMELATRLAHGATQSISLIKYLVQKSTHTDMRKSLEMAHVAQEASRATEDHKEAVQAFIDKRRPDFKGR
jgi:enoyl-CoA hydratase/carnithine racemase